MGKAHRALGRIVAHSLEGGQLSPPQATRGVSTQLTQAHRRKAKNPSLPAPKTQHWGASAMVAELKPEWGWIAQNVDEWYRGAS